MRNEGAAMSLSVWLKAGHTVEVMRRQSADFTAETGIEVDISVVPEGQAHDHLVSGARRPDVVTVPHWYLDELVDLDVLRPVGDPTAMPADARFPTAALSALSQRVDLGRAAHADGRRPVVPQGRARAGGCRPAANS